MRKNSGEISSRRSMLLIFCFTLVVFIVPATITQAQIAETPLWKLGISTFSVKKAEEKAAAGPSFVMPPESEATAIQTTAYQLDGNTTLAAPIGSAVATPSLEIAMPLPDLPVSDVLALPVVPGPVTTGPTTTGPTTTGPGDVADGASAIANAIASGETLEDAPLAEETVSWYQVPWRWVSRGWENHAELGLDGSSGNSQTVAFQTGLEMKRKTDTYTLGMDFDYRKAANAGVTTEDNGRFNLDYDRLLVDSKWSAFGKFGAEWDQFKAFDSRLNLNGGVGYHFVRTDDALFVTRFGAGASQEIGAPEDDWKPEAVFGAEAEYQINRYNKMKGKVDYFPAWEDFADYRVVTDLAWEILLDDTDNLSLKLALTDRYDSTPQGAKPNDVYYSLLLLVKF